MATLAQGPRDSRIMGANPASFRALLVGFNAYEGNGGTPWDASARLEVPLAEALCNERGVPRENVRVLRDAEGTREMVLSAAQEMATASSSGDTLLIFYGSHGSLQVSGDPLTYRMSAYDTHITGKEFLSCVLDAFPREGRLVWITDTCYSGSMNQVVRHGTRGSPGISTACISSTASYQTAWSKWRMWRCVLDGVLGLPGASDGVGRVTIGSLMNFICARLSFHAQNHAEGYMDASFGDDTVAFSNASMEAPWWGEEMIQGNTSRVTVIGRGFEDSVRVRSAGKDWNHLGEVVPRNNLTPYVDCVASGSDSPLSCGDHSVGAKVKFSWHGSEWPGIFVPGTVVGVEHGLLCIDREGDAAKLLPKGRLWVPATLVKPPSYTVPNEALQVTGAGCGIVNGIYVSAGQWRGKPMYRKQDNGMELWWNGNWRLGKTNDYYYMCDEEEAFGEGSLWRIASLNLNNDAAGTSPPASVRPLGTEELPDKAEFDFAKGNAAVKVVRRTSASENVRVAFTFPEGAIVAEDNSGPWIGACFQGNLFDDGNDAWYRMTTQRSQCGIDWPSRLFPDDEMKTYTMVCVPVGGAIKSPLAAVNFRVAFQ